MVERFHMKTHKHDKLWMVQLVIGTKIKINELGKDCPLDMDGLNIFVYLNIIPLYMIFILVWIG